MTKPPIALTEVELVGFARALDVLGALEGEAIHDAVACALMEEWHDDNESMRPWVGCPDASELAAFALGNHAQRLLCAVALRDARECFQRAADAITDERIAQTEAVWG